MWKWECNESWIAIELVKTGLSPVNGLIQQPKLFNKYYISFWNQHFIR